MSTAQSERRMRCATRDSGRWLIMSIRPILAALSILLLAACSALPTPAVPDYDSNSFDGMSALVGNNPPARPLHIFMVHGIGTTTPDQFEGFIAALAHRLRLVQIPPSSSEAEPLRCPEDPAPSSALVRPEPTRIKISGVPPCAWAKLYNYDFASAADVSYPPTPVLKVGFLLWAPLTGEIKSTALEEKGAPPPQEFAYLAKDVFIDHYLADVVLYGGTYRNNVMRPSVQAALCLVAGGHPIDDGKTCLRIGNYNDPTIIVTHSLGGYMLMDAIDDDLRREHCAPNTLASKILRNTKFIYMMANQLALLDLSTLRGYPQRLGGSRADDNLAHRFATCWEKAKLDAPSPVTTVSDQEAASAEEQVVAFSDPNDILTWLVKRKNLKLPRSDWGSAQLTNVYLSNDEFSIPLLFSEPSTAHGGYLDNPTVLEMLVCGMDKGAIKACLPNGIP
jgi:hypothetical protein